MAAITSQPAPHVAARPSLRSRKTLGLILLVATALVGAGSIGWVVRGPGKNAPTASTALTVSIAEAQSRFIEFAMLVDPLCEGIGPPLSDPVKQAFAAGQCETALTATAGMIRASSWPEEAKNQAEALATAIDKHIAFLQRLDAATPAEHQRLVAGTYKDLTKSPWMITHGAAGAMREAIKLGGSSGNLL